MENIKKILETEAGLLIENNNNKSTKIEKKIIDNRFELIKKNINSIEYKDDNFYTELIRLICNYLDKLYDSEIKNYQGIVLDQNGELISLDYDVLNFSDIFNLERANRKLSENLFEYICDILEKNKDIKLDIEILKRLLNRNPKLFTLSVEESYLYRTFNFNKLVKIINKNQTLEKSNIKIDDVYQLLIDTCQIDNNEVFGSLINSAQFHENHQKIDDLLTWCNAKTFVRVTNTIIMYFDKEFDRLSIVKERNKNNFCERMIINLLESCPTKEDHEFIHEILTDESININYNLYWADYSGQTTLKEIIAFSSNKTIIKDLLSKEENIQNNYWYGESRVPLYKLYAITGEYEKALTLFKENYNYAYDFTEDFTKGFNNEGYAYGEITYKDSLVSFIKSICNSFENENIEYSEKKSIINRILNSEKVKYINLEEILPIVRNILSEEDFNSLLDTLIEKYNDGNLKFIVVNDRQGSIYEYYIIKIASDEQVQDILSTFNKKRENKSLSLKKQRN